MVRPSMAEARAVLQRLYGYPDFRAPQLPAIEAILSRRDAVIVLPTGGGKSICFQVPALCFPRLTVVVSPLISLMADQVQTLERRGVAATYLNSTLSPDESSARTDRIRRGEIRLLYVAPERLTLAPMLSLLGEVGVDMLAVDEAHCVSEWGQDFRPSYLKLVGARRQFGDPQTVALTATATPRVRHDVARLLELRDPAVVVGGFDRPNLTFRVQLVESEPARHQAMVAHLRRTTDPAVVYAATRKQVEQVARILSSGGVDAVPYHAGLPAERRARTQDAFMSGSRRVIVATNAFGMGIDKPNVRLVLHYLHSGSLEDYYQEAGRAGRDGAHSNCLLLFSPNDRRVHDRMRDNGNVATGIVRSVWQAMAGLSEGRRPAPVEPGWISAKLRVSAAAVERALALLEERGELGAVERLGKVKIRVLATPLRAECERNSISGDASRVLDALMHDEALSDPWLSRSASGFGLADRRFDQVLEELESRQLVFVDRAPPRTVLASDYRSRARLERLLRRVEVRREVERAKLDSMVGYATSLMCRRRYILNYFGDRDGVTKCGECDVCLPTA